MARANLLPRYERQLRQWRRRLQEHRGNTEAVKEVREELIAFRRARRGEGWELRLGSLDVQVRGFRGDTAMAEGFRRIVLKLGESGRIYYLVGEANHIQLDEELSIRMRQAGVSEGLQSHYLWYRRMEGILEFAGADSEPKENLQLLVDYVAQNKSQLVHALYRLV
ncbi:MAG: hypothetical protein MI717_03510 [Spirochaetales bacterium]|nr:hypothetical protein [Spirochaetales bacterium]